VFAPVGVDGTAAGTQAVIYALAFGLNAVAYALLAVRLRRSAPLRA
jgi:hypothetical protein